VEVILKHFLSKHLEIEELIDSKYLQLQFTGWEVV